MENKDYILAAVLVIVLLGAGFAIGNFITNGSKTTASATTSKVANNQAIKSPGNLNYETKSSQAEVAIDLTPKKFENGKLYVDISVNTHTVDLSKFELAKLVKLEYDSKSIFPISAPKLSGHHNSGTLIFDSGKELKSFKIVINGIPDVQERMFKWP